MIRILIVDDLLPKRERIKQAILDNNDISEENIVIATCIKEAKKILYSECFDLLILDLVLPIDNGDECNAQNAIRFLSDIEINPSIKPPIHILGISGYKDQVEEFNKDFNLKLWNLINYEEASSYWQDRLQSIIFHLVKTRQQFIGATISKQLDIINQELQKSNIPNTSLGYCWNDVLTNIANVVERSFDVSGKFANGTRAKNINSQTIVIDSEYDFQNLIHLILRPWIPSLEPENIVVIFDGNTKNADFSIKNNSLIIEAKYIDSTGKKNDVLKTLDGLKNFYTKNGNVRALLFLLVVNNNIEIDKHKIESEFSQLSATPPICVKVIINTIPKV